MDEGHAYEWLVVMVSPDSHAFLVLLDTHCRRYISSGLKEDHLIELIESSLLLSEI